jgi:hypothetical protein
LAGGLTLLIVATLMVGATPAAAAVATTTGSCVDGGGIRWSTKVSWGSSYRSSTTNEQYVSVAVAAWTTVARTMRTDSTVKTYSRGALWQTLTRTAARDYQSGQWFDSQNPKDPVSAPGSTKIVVSVGKDGDGKANCSVTHWQPNTETATSAATQGLGPTRSGLAWHSGAWVGNRLNTAGINSFGTWRGRPADVVMTFPKRDSYSAMISDTWSYRTWNGFPGRLVYSLPMLPKDGAGSLSSIAAGNQDHVWRTIARNLKSAGRGDSIIRIGWEQNIKDWRWYTNASTAGQYKAAFRRVVQVMRAEASGLKFDFVVNCGSDLDGSSDRLAPLKLVYPGDDVVDLVGCDAYDWWALHVTSDADLGHLLHPKHGPGVQDIVNFARAHGKGASFPEWGLAARQGSNNAGGDNPYFISAMHRFFAQNKDVVAYESYFDQPYTSLGSSLQIGGKNPKAAATYVRLW